MYSSAFMFTMLLPAFTINTESFYNPPSFEILASSSYPIINLASVQILWSGLRTHLFLGSILRLPSPVSGMPYVFAQNHKSERDSNIIVSLSFSWFRAKTQRIPDTWDGTHTFWGFSQKPYLLMSNYVSKGIENFDQPSTNLYPFS